MIDLVSLADGTVISVRAHPGARKNAVTGEHDGALKIAVTAPPDKGSANAAIAAILAESFGVAKSDVNLVSGQTSRQKKFLLRSVTTVEAQEIVARLLAR